MTIVICEIFSCERNCVHILHMLVFEMFVGWHPKKVPIVPFFGSCGTLTVTLTGFIVIGMEVVFLTFVNSFSTKFL